MKSISWAVHILSDRDTHKKQSGVITPSWTEVHDLSPNLRLGERSEAMEEGGWHEGKKEGAMKWTKEHVVPDPSSNVQ